MMQITKEVKIYIISER